MQTPENNIQLYAWYRAAADIQAWIPVFFLYFSQFVELNEVIELAAIYYIFVCLLEVPSGYFSDRVGRRTTLIIAACCALFAYSLFLIGEHFIFLAAGQIFLAASIAMQSGSDTTLHYDSLVQLDRQSEYAEREARAEKYGLLALALSTLAGGILALIDLRLAYALSLVGAAVTLYLAYRLIEPVTGQPASEGGFHFIGSLAVCLKYLKNPLLGGLFLFKAIMYCLEHIPFEFYQAYLQLLQFDLSERIALTPLWSGLVISISMFGGALGAAASIKWYRKLGLYGVLCVAFSVQLTIVAGLASILHWSMLALIIFRNFPMSLTRAPIIAAIVPSVHSGVRATYLSLQSLAARFLFSTVLFVLSWSINSEQILDWNTLSAILSRSLWFALAGVLVLAVYRRHFHER